jgi:hypothetical protein
MLDLELKSLKYYRPKVNEKVLLDWMDDYLLELPTTSDLDCYSKMRELLPHRQLESYFPLSEPNRIFVK